MYYDVTKAKFSKTYMGAQNTSTYFHKGINFCMLKRYWISCKPFCEKFITPAPSYIGATKNGK